MLTPLILAHRRQRQVDGSLVSLKPACSTEFQNSWSCYTEKPLSQKRKEKKEKTKLEKAGSSIPITT